MCGFWCKTKWYFTLNAFIQELVGYLSLTWKKHIIAIGINVWIEVKNNEYNMICILFFFEIEKRIGEVRYKKEVA